MEREKFIRVINAQEKNNQKRLKQNFIELLDEEFVLEEFFLRYLEHLEKGENDHAQYRVLLEMFKHNGPPTKKLKEFDISKQMQGQNMYLHKHTYIEIDYVYEGYCEYHIANENEVFRLEEKQLCIVNQDVVHGIDIPEENSIIIKCMIPFRYIRLEDFEEFSKEHPVVQLLEHSLKDIRTYASFVVYQVKEPNYVEELFYNLFVEFLEKKLDGGMELRICCPVC